MKPALFVFLIWSVSVKSQILNFDKSGTIEQTYEIKLPEKKYQKLLNSKGAKINFSDFEVFRNSNPLDVLSLKLRGNNSLKFRRKSFAIALNDSIVEGHPVSKLSLTNLVMDKNYWRNRVCFVLLEQLGLFPLYNAYTEVRINGDTQGIYLVQQKVDDYAKNIEHTPLLLRRTQTNDFKEYVSKEQEGKKRKKQLLEVRDQSSSMSGEKLYDYLSVHLDLDQYFRLLAFYSFVLNGDYTDELYIYFDNSQLKFRVIPWDFDDVFAQAPHEGWENRKLALSNMLIFSSEPYFDVLIDKDAFLYNKFLISYEGLLDELHDSAIKKAFEKVYRELYPYYANDQIIAQSKYDANGLTNLSDLEKDLELHFQYMTTRRKNLILDLNVVHK